MFFYGKSVFSSTEMRGLVRLSQRPCVKKYLPGLCISGCVHITPQTAIFIELIHKIGCHVRWSPCNPASTDDSIVSALRDKGISVFGHRDCFEDYWDFIGHSLDHSNCSKKVAFIDDGGDLFHYFVSGYLYELGSLSFSKSSMMDSICSFLEKDRCFFSKINNKLIGVSEQTTTGAVRLEKNYKRLSNKNFFGIDINSSVTKCKFDNLYGCRESLPDALRRSLGLTISGKECAVLGYGLVGKGCVQALQGAGARVSVTEIDPICALQAYMEGINVFSMDDAEFVKRIDIFVTATGNKNVIDAPHFCLMKNCAVLCNIGQYDNEINTTYLKKYNWTSVCKGVDVVSLQSGKNVFILARGLLVNLVCSHGHPSFVMSMTFSNHLLSLVQMCSWIEEKKKPGIYTLSRFYDEEIARCHLLDTGCCLTELTQEQSAYINVPQKGPFKKLDYLY